MLVNFPTTSIKSKGSQRTNTFSNEKNKVKPKQVGRIESIVLHILYCVVFETTPFKKDLFLCFLYRDKK